MEGATEVVWEMEAYGPVEGGGTWGSVEARSGAVQNCSVSKTFQNPFHLPRLPPIPSHQPVVVGMVGKNVGSIWVQMCLYS